MADIQVNIKDNFARSTNIKLDFYQEKELKDVILSDKFQDRYVEVARPLVDKYSNQRVHVIAGTPGTGKSTFALFLARSITKNNRRSVSTVIKNQRVEVSERFRQCWSKIHKTSYLPVFLNGDEGEIEDAFYSALSDVFARHGWQKQFDQLASCCSARALNIISRWQRDYPHKHKELRNIIDEKTGNYKRYINALRKNRLFAQKIFSEIYGQITGGAHVSSYRYGNIVNLYRDATKYLRCHSEYAGIFIIYDEFGKFLERGIRQSKNFDLQFLQDMAELCNKGEEQHTHLLLISHLPLSQYTYQLSPCMQQEWQKIEGRFQQLSFNRGGASNYNIVASVFSSDNCLHKKFVGFVDCWQKQNQITNNLLALCACKRKTLSICYPLHPLVIGLLPLLSEKVAQNERTMFSFLTRNEEFSLPRYLVETKLEKNKLQFMPLANFYNYFAPLIGSNNQEGRQAKIKVIVDDLLNNLEPNNLCAKDIVILLSLVEIINNRTIINVNKQSIFSLLLGLHRQEKIAKELSYLQKLKMITFNKLKQEFNLFDGSPINLSEEIASIRQTKLTTADYCCILKKNFPLSFLTPKKYNFNHGITRFFREQLLSIEDLESDRFKINYAQEDGKIFYTVPFTESEVCHIKHLLRQIHLPSALFITTNEPVNITDNLLELQAIEQIYSRKDLISTGTTAKKELDHHRHIAQGLIKKSLEKIRSNLHMDASIFYLGDCLDNNVKSLSYLASFASEICTREYTKYPLFNNEMLNRHRASTPVIQGRSRFIGSFTNYFDQPRRLHVDKFFIEGGGPDFAIFKALFRANTFVDKSDDLLKLKRSSALFPLFTDFCDLLKESEQTSVSLNDLISRWQKPPFGVRVSLIPLYVSVFVRLTPSPVSFYYNGIYVARIDADLFEGLIRQPKKYSIRMVVVDAEKRVYLQRLREKFSACLPMSMRLDQPLLSFANVAALVSQFHSIIPNYTRRHELLTPRMKKLVNALDSLCQPEIFFLTDLPKIYQQKIFSELRYTDKHTLLQNLEKDLLFLFNCYVNLIKRLAKKQGDVLCKLQENNGVERKIVRGAPLSKYWKTTMQSLPKRVLTFPFSSVTRHLINRIMQLGNEASNQLVVENIADALTGANPKNWNEKGEVLFDFNLQRSIAEIEEVNHLQTRDKVNLVRISSLKHNSEPVVYEIVQADLNLKFHGKLLDEFYNFLGHLPDTEKNTILLELIKKINIKKLLHPSKVTDEASIGEAWG